MKDIFENWLIVEDDKTNNTAYSYKNAISKLSIHYSKQISKTIDLFYSDLKTLKKVQKLYSLDGNQSEFGSNSKGINRNAIVALLRFYKTFPTKSAREFYSKITEPDIKNAFKIIDESGLELKPITKFAVVNKTNGNSYPPKDVVRIIARSKQISLNEDTFFGGEANAPFMDIEHICKIINLKNNELDLNKLIEKVINSDFIQKLKNENHFYFQKLLDVKDKFLNYSITQDNLKEILSSYNDFENGTYEDFVNSSNGKEQDFLNILGELISYLDEKASGKKKWNQYDPSRTIAQAGVRQDNWVRHLLNYKIDSNHIFSGSIDNALNYAVSPIDNLTVLSENHRKKLATFLFQKDYNKDTFSQNFIHFFKPFNIDVKNNLNYTFLISSIVYDASIEFLWNPKEKKKKDIFEKFKYYLKTENLSSSTKDAYYLSIKTAIPKLWKAKYPDSFKPIKTDLNFLKKVYKLTQKSFEHGLKGKQNFQNFLKALIEEFNQLPKIDPLTTNSSLNKIFFGPPGTGKTFKIIEDYITNTKTHLEKIDSTKQMIDLKKGFWHLAPGEGGYLWNDLKEDNYLGYEYCSHHLGDLSKVSKEEPSYDMKRRFSKVKKGDYICIISGKKFYAIAKALHDYDPAKSKNSDFDFQTVKVEWFKKFRQPELLNTYSTQSFSNLRGSKRWQSLLDALEAQDIYPETKAGKEVQKSSKNYSLVSFHQSFGYEDFIEGIKPDLEIEDEDDDDIKYLIQDGIFKQSCDKAARLAGYEDLNSCIEDTKVGRQQNFQDAPPFYLLIDEINRGNISAIFGELITLIEKDKRLGNKYELMTDLPYSKREFGVPANLHVIGTMNTADRSVEALDTALRRRFSFVEIAPNTNILKEKHPTSGIILDTLDLKIMLDKINDRIELLINKDHKIGHSYLINVTTLEGLKAVFKDEIIPLMEEYFYGDFGKIGLVLGNQFVYKVDDKGKADFANFKYDDRQALREKLIYKFTPYREWSKETFISIYDPSILEQIEQK